MGRPKVDTVQITLRIPRAWLPMLDEIAKEETARAHGMPCSRTGALRVALLHGMLDSRRLDGPRRK